MFVRVGAYRYAKGDHFRGLHRLSENLSSDVTRKGNPSEIVTLSVKDWLTLLGIVFPILILCIFGWLRHDRLLTEVAANQRMLTDRLQRVETTLDAGRIP
jgi:hypothetical protein